MLVLPRLCIIRVVRWVLRPEYNLNLMLDICTAIVALQRTIPIGSAKMLLDAFQWLCNAIAEKAIKLLAAGFRNDLYRVLAARTIFKFHIPRSLYPARP